MSIARTVEPELSLAYGAGNDVEARGLFLRSSHAGFWLSTSLSLIVAIVGPLFYQMWAGRQLELDRLALCFLLMASVLNVLWGIALTMPCSINRHTSLSAPFFTLYGAGTVVVVFILSKQHMGISGAAFGILIGDLLALALVLVTALRVGNISLPDWLKAVRSSPIEILKQLALAARLAVTRRLAR
jgi:O-antigen/teichoic acid export membrane protein